MVLDTFAAAEMRKAHWPYFNSNTLFLINSKQSHSPQELLNSLPKIPYIIFVYKLPHKPYNPLSKEPLTSPISTIKMQFNFQIVLNTLFLLPLIVAALPAPVAQPEPVAVSEPTLRLPRDIEVVKREPVPEPVANPEANPGGPLCVANRCPKK
ncbi:hypothetical protein ABW19_dt0205643 [Dactylella cylindrospora]|nr:hypothetical protein ABW19_dt0205643 [Dactylella cylindrospora]